MVGEEEGEEEGGRSWGGGGGVVGEEEGLNAMVYTHTNLLIECPSRPSTLNIQIGILLHLMVPLSVYLYPNTFCIR